MPVTWVLGSEPHRFGELRHELSGITPRALTLSLKDMEGGGLVHREVFEDYPPVTGSSYHWRRQSRAPARATPPKRSVLARVGKRRQLVFSDS
jgi:DNA-binding HxlR family transcriptional regulator